MHIIIFYNITKPTSSKDSVEQVSICSIALEDRKKY